MMGQDSYRALREGTGLVRRPGRGLVGVTGSDRFEYLQGQLTNDIAGLDEGRGCYAAYLTPQGRMIADMDIFNVRDIVLLDIDESVRDLLVERLQELVFVEDVEIVDWSDGWVSYGAIGPLAPQILETVLRSLGADPVPLATELEDRHVAQLRVDGWSVFVTRTDLIGVMGFTIWVQRVGADQFVGALVENGCVEVDSAVADVVRIENGRPLFPVDLDSNTIPLEAGIEDRAISSTKGCYVGQEVIVRILHRGLGRVARRLTGLTTDASTLESGPVAGATVWSGDRKVGSVTSVATSPTLGSVIALGYVARAHLEPGTRLEVDVESGRCAAIVTKLPFLL